MRTPFDDASQLRVLVRAATSRDARMATDVLANAGIASYSCGDMACLLSELDGGVGCLLLAEETLTDDHVSELVLALTRQPEWSDLPVMILARQGADSRTVASAMNLSANVTVLERPIRVASLISSVRSALRARRRQYELRDVLQGLRESDQRKSEFIATLAHELRNPLAPLSTVLSILTRSTPSKEQAHGYYQVMDRQVRHMVRLVDDLMEISRLTRAQINLNLEAIALHEVIQEAIELSRPLLDGPGHTLIVAIPEHLRVHGDRVRLIQVFSNLLNNAAKYTAKYGQIEVTAQGVEDDVTISIRDNGIGIPKDMLESVFGMFVQVNGAARTAQGGLGIGLTLVRNLLELHGGSVSATSGGPGQGTCVTVTLPMPGAATQPEPMASVPEPEAKMGDRILIVDDNRDAADSLAAVLTLMGASTTVAYSGMDALEKAAQTHPSIAILDIGMPGMDGCELAQRLRMDPNHDDLALVALTGWGQSSDRDRVASAGFDRHLLKPVDIDDLNRTLLSLSARDA